MYPRAGRGVRHPTDSPPVPHSSSGFEPVRRHVAGEPCVSPCPRHVLVWLVVLAREGRSDTFHFEPSPSSQALQVVCVGSGLRPPGSGVLPLTLPLQGRGPQVMGVSLSGPWLQGTRPGRAWSEGHLVAGLEPEEARRAALMKAVVGAGRTEQHVRAASWQLLGRRWALGLTCFSRKPGQQKEKNHRTPV